MFMITYRSCPAKLLLNMDIFNLREFSSNAALFECSVAKFNLRQPSWLNVKFKDNFLNLFDFTFVSFQALFTRCVSNKLASLLHIFYNILKFPVVPSLTKLFEIMVAATLGKNLEPSIANRSDDLGPSIPKRSDTLVFKKQKLQTTGILSVPF